ncbi:hypothetical protein ACWY4P_40570 [Streptomyces sp. LZ34]
MTGRHRAIDRVRALKAENTDLTCKLVALAGQVDLLQGQLDTAGIELSGLRIDYEKAVVEIRRLQQQVIDDAAEKERLRQALIQARPRISVVASPVARPFAPDSVLPLPQHAA